MEKLTKVQAIAKVLRRNGGAATWKTIYAEIEQHYKGAKASAFWQEGLRGVVYREQRYGRTFTVKNGLVSLK